MEPSWLLSTKLTIILTKSCGYEIINCNIIVSAILLFILWHKHKFCLFCDIKGQLLSKLSAESLASNWHLVFDTWFPSCFWHMISIMFLTHDVLYWYKWKARAASRLISINFDMHDIWDCWSRISSDMQEQLKL